MLHVVAIILALLVVAAVAGWMTLRRALNPPPNGPNPFDPKHYTRHERRPLVVDHQERDKVLKQGYLARKVPENLDAIIIGSGMGGLVVASLLARVGKKVLVLEQHDRAGGNCHTFRERGFEFDTGIHYIGETQNNTVFRLLLDVMTGDQLEWSPLPDQYDRVVLGQGAEQRQYPIVGNKSGGMRSALVKSFPKEEEAIDKFLELMQGARRSTVTFLMTKLMPRWLLNLLSTLGVTSFITAPFMKYAGRTVNEVLDSITDNPDLKAVLAYSYGDYGTHPSEASFWQHANLWNHFLYGAAFPEGGPSEIPFHVIPIVEQAGGKVLVRATVAEIIVERGTAVGVRMKKDNNIIRAPIVVSGAGVFNTYEKLLAPQITRHYGMDKQLQTVRHGTPLMSVFIGLRGDGDEIGLPMTHTWAFKSNDHDQMFKDFVSAKGEMGPPFMFVSFPSRKDPTWKSRFPGKSTCEIVTVAPYEWFEDWRDERVMKRAKEYKELKNRIARDCWRWVCELHPDLDLDSRVEYFDAGSPLTNDYYLGSSRGDVYGVDHNCKRFEQLWMRPDTPIKNLYMTGQDVFVCGFAGATFGGLLSASSILERNLYDDLQKLKKTVRPKGREQS